jgi:hypothetical protein
MRPGNTRRAIAASLENGSFFTRIGFSFRKRNVHLLVVSIRAGPGGPALLDHRESAGVPSLLDHRESAGVPSLLDHRERA